MSRQDFQLPNEIKEVIELYQGRLASVSFPGIDRQALEGLAVAAGERHASLEAARVALDRARAAFEQELEGLRREARKALDYALIYAGEDPDLAAELESFELKKPPPVPRSRRSKGARRKVSKTAQLALAGDEPAASTSGSGDQPSISVASLSSSAS